MKNKFNNPFHDRIIIYPSKIFAQINRRVDKCSVAVCNAFNAKIEVKLEKEKKIDNRLNLKIFLPLLR